MDTPLILALCVFFGIFLMFFFLSLLSDLLIIGIAVGCAAAAYFIPDWYPMLYEALQGSPLLTYLSLGAPETLSASNRYVLSALLTLLGALFCIPALPFSATYRQLLGANKIGRQDESYIKSLVRSELEALLRKRTPEEKSRVEKPKATRIQPAVVNPEPRQEPTLRTEPGFALESETLPPLPMDSRG